jgi:hypothetical protein
LRSSPVWPRARPAPTEQFHPQIGPPAPQESMSTLHGPGACSRCAVPKTRRLPGRVCALQLVSVRRHAKRCLPRTQPRCYRIMEHARLSSAKTTNAAIAHDHGQSPPLRPMAMPSLAVIMRMYCEAFVAPAWRAVKRKTGSRGSTPCTLGSPEAVSSVSVRAPFIHAIKLHLHFRMTAAPA